MFINIITLPQSSLWNNNRKIHIVYKYFKIPCFTCLWLQFDVRLWFGMYDTHMNVFIWSFERRIITDHFFISSMEHAVQVLYPPTTRRPSFVKKIKVWVSLNNAVRRNAYEACMNPFSGFCLLDFKELIKDWREKGLHCWYTLSIIFIDGVYQSGSFRIYQFSFHIQQLHFNLNSASYLSFLLISSANPCLATDLHSFSVVFPFVVNLL